MLFSYKDYEKITIVFIFGRIYFFIFSVDVAFTGAVIGTNIKISNISFLV